MNNSQQQKSGLSLLELLAVISIMGILISFIIPSVNQVRRRTKQMLCLSNLRQLSLAMRLYADDFEGLFPKSLYDGGVVFYYNNQQGVVTCPEDNSPKDESFPGSYGVNRWIKKYKLANLPDIDPETNRPIPIVGDSKKGTLTKTNFFSRHKRLKKKSMGNIAFIDGHVESLTKAQAGKYF